MELGPPARPASGVLLLDPLAQAVAAARRFLRDTLPSVDGESMRDNAELAISELVTNATLHARTPMQISVFRTPEGRMRISVRDGSTGIPQPRNYELTATTGRGLRLIDSVCTRWGIDPIPADQGGGKVVWCEPKPDAESTADRAGEWGDVIAELT